MPESPRLSSRIVWGAAALALVAGLSVGRLAAMPSASPGSRGTDLETAAKPAQGANAPAQVAKSDGVKRYMVPVSKSQPSKGAAEPLVTIVQWCQLYGPDCRDVQKVLGQVLKAYDGDVKLAFRYLAPQTVEGQLPHEFARMAHQEGGLFWEAHDQLLKFDRPPTRPELEQIAKEIRLNADVVKEGLDKHSHRGHVLADRVFAKMFDVQQAPTFHINGRPLSAPFTFERFKAVIDEEIGSAKALIASGVSRAEVYKKITESGAWNKLTKEQIAASQR